jgi:hypothetical protein
MISRPYHDHKNKQQSRITCEESNVARSTKTYPLEESRHEDAFRRLSSPPLISFEAACREQQENGSQGGTVRTHLKKPKISDRAIFSSLIRALVWICETNRNGLHYAN